MDNSIFDSQAFPVVAGPGDTVVYGMSLRDYFAAKAMQQLIGECFKHRSGNDYVAKEAYAVADEMLKAR